VSQLPIADYALLTDCHSGALVSRGGSIDWLCFPRFDSPSVFARILDDAAGHWWIRPPEGTGFETARRYLDGTMVLETTFTTETGAVRLTDALALGRNERGHGLGANAVNAVLRRVDGVAGTVQLELAYAPRPDYAVAVPTLRSSAGDCTAQTADRSMTLFSAVPLEIAVGTASATLTSARRALAAALSEPDAEEQSDG